MCQSIENGGMVGVKKSHVQTYNHIYRCVNQFRLVWAVQFESVSLLLLGDRPNTTSSICYIMFFFIVFFWFPSPFPPVFTLSLLLSNIILCLNKNKLINPDKWYRLWFDTIINCHLPVWICSIFNVCKFQSLVSKIVVNY